MSAMNNYRPNPPVMASVWTGMIQFPSTLSPKDAWRFLTGIRDPKSNKKTIINFAASLVLGNIFIYAVGWFILTRLMGSGEYILVSEVSLASIAILLSIMVISGGLAFDVLNPELAWLVKWSYVRGKLLTLHEICCILNGDQGLQATKNIAFGSIQSKVLALYSAFIRVGPPIAYSFLFSGYEIACDEPGSRYPWSFGGHARMGYVAGGFILLIAISCLSGWIAYSTISKDTIPPNSLLASALAFRKVVPRSTTDRTVNAYEPEKQLGPFRRTVLEAANIDTELVYLFRELEAIQQVSPENLSESKGAAWRKTAASKLPKKLTQSSQRRKVERFAGAFLCSIILAAGLHAYLQHFNSRPAGSRNTCIGVDDTKYFGGTISAKQGLSILTSVYGIAIAASFDQVMQIYRWSMLYQNEVSVMVLENVFRAHCLTSYYCFLHLKHLRWRGFLTGLLATVMVRVALGLVPVFALLRGWDSILRSETYLNTATWLVWVSLISVFATWALAMWTAWDYYIPDDNVLVTAVIFGDLVKQIEAPHHEEEFFKVSVSHRTAVREGAQLAAYTIVQIPPV